MPDHPWPSIRGVGNRLRHAYDRLAWTIIWNVVAYRLPPLRHDAQAALDTLHRA